MAYTRVDAELMTNYVAARNVPAGSHFIAALDQNDELMVFSLSDDPVPKFLLIRQDNEGVQYEFNLNACCDIPETAIIQAFDFHQDADRTLYLALAYQHDDQDTSAHLMLSQPFQPSLLQEGEIIPKLKGEEKKLGPVKRIFMTPMPTVIQSSAEYPLVLLTHENFDQLTSWGDDITEVIVEPNLTGWFTSNALSTPVNVARVLDIATATNFHGQGIFVLYETSSGESRVYGQFLKPDDQSSDGTIFRFQTEVQCPSDTQGLSTARDSRKNSALLLGSSSGLHYLDANRAVDKNATPELISREDEIQGCKSPKIVQDDNLLSIWFTSGIDQLGYIRATVTELADKALQRPVLLMTAGESTSFAPLIIKPCSRRGDVAWQTLVSNDYYGNLTLLEQATDQGLWRAKPYYSNDETEIYPVESFSMTITAFDKDHSPLRDSSVHISAASAVTGLLNGRAVTLTGSGFWYKADSEGMLNLIIPTKGIASQSLTIDSIQNADGDTLVTERTLLDPNRKVMNRLEEKLKSFRSIEDLKDARTEDGELLFNPNDMPSDEDLQNGLQSFHLLCEAYNQLPADGSSPEIRPEGWFDWAAEAWNWVKDRFRDARDWFVDTAGKVWKFVCNIAGEAFEFVLDTIEKIGEVLTWIWNKLKVAFEWLIKFIGFLFNWGDILKTKNQISSLLTTGCDLVANKLGDAAGGVDQFFARLIENIDDLGVEQDVEVSPGTGSDRSESSTVRDAQLSTSVNWAPERMKNGGLKSSNAVKSENDPTDDAEKTWADIFEPALLGIMDAAIEVGDSIKDLWTSKGSISASSFMDIGKNLLKLAVETIRRLVVAIIQSFEKLVHEVKDIGNKPIKVPVFSALYKLIARHELTIFDAISLLVAIPTTIFTKLIIGQTPPIIDNLDAALLDKLLFDSGSVPPQVQLDFNTFTTSLTVTTTMVKTVTNLIKYFYTLATKGSGGALKTMTASRFILLFSVSLDMFSTLNSFPTDASLPGLEYRQWISYLSLIRGGANIFASFVSADAKGSGTARDKVLLVLDLATCLTIFGLYQAVGAAEIEAGSSWEDYNLESTITGIQGSVLNGVSGIGYFIAYMFQEEVPVSGVGLAILEAATGGLAALEGIKWKIDHDRQKRCLLIPAAY
ncbi:hypothetical protein COH20_010367 [Aspergillus flavus]|nr:hypothetical protein COH20_010367 [Aspergillus flavus]RAQ81172.1 hypothetical protein COH21_010013 [Aspergillus flavus]